MAVLTRRLLLDGTATDNTRDRSEALDAGDRMVEGAHRTGQNRESVGIENEGACTDRPPTAARWAALVWLGARVCERRGTEPAEIDGHHDHGDGTVRPRRRPPRPAPAAARARGRAPTGDLRAERDGELDREVPEAVGPGHGHGDAAAGADPGRARSGSRTVIPAHSSGAAAAGSRPSGSAEATGTPCAPDDPAPRARA
ncbi:N-acetylmuramoyl-L-alanine amidase [Actinosynnema pretiosum subsp. pretiosum]|uniref:N-acetylmuramoyl-L-alanine amidase n=1 Tax=Actinosynnema pretiosum subsp. pretiosum TaxID=103721 RepID=A0AA45R3J3_9PSEU|nr:N-acetylmuramoyl-L-alanine amidase [Actinosynnema pretiosum subsp. pretiosum]